MSLCQFPKHGRERQASWEGCGGLATLSVQGLDTEACREEQGTAGCGRLPMATCKPLWGGGSHACARLWSHVPSLHITVNIVQKFKFRVERGTVGRQKVGQKARGGAGADWEGKEE